MCSKSVQSPYSADLAWSQLLVWSARAKGNTAPCFACQRRARQEGSAEAACTAGTMRTQRPACKSCVHAGRGSAGRGEPGDAQPGLPPPLPCPAGPCSRHGHAAVESRVARWRIHPLPQLEPWQARPLSWASGRAELAGCPQSTGHGPFDTKPTACLRTPALRSDSPWKLQLPTGRTSQIQLQRSLRFTQPSGITGVETAHGTEYQGRSGCMAQHVTRRGHLRGRWAAGRAAARCPGRSLASWRRPAASEATAPAAAARLPAGTPPAHQA